MNDKNIIIFFSSILFLNVFVKILKKIINERRPNEKCCGMPSSKATVTTFIFIYLINMYKFKQITIVILLIIMCLTLYVKHLYKEHTFQQLLIGSIIGFIFAKIIVYIS